MLVTPIQFSLQCTVHDKTCSIQGFLDVVEDHLSDSVFFQVMSELEQGCGVRNRIRHEIQAHKLPHAIAVVYDIFYTVVGLVKPDPEQKHPNHRPYSTGWTATFSRGITQSLSPVSHGK